jgi:hypothetical protein
MAPLILEESIDLDLKALTALTAYVGAGVFYIAADQDFEGPAYVVFRKINEDYPKDNKNVDWPIRNANTSFVCYSTNRFNARKMANVIIAHYKDLNGKLGSTDGVIVLEIIITGDADIGIIDEKFAVNIDLIIKYKSQ